MSPRAKLRVKNRGVNVSERIVIATRESPLALWQAEYVKSRLEALHAGIEVQLLGMTSRGDQLLDQPLFKVGGKGLFVKELETALLDGRADIAVHSMKDVPMVMPDELTLGVICEREDPRDALVGVSCFQDLPQGGRLGTSSLRRSLIPNSFAANFLFPSCLSKDFFISSNSLSCKDNVSCESNS